jgi:hypothetical protein
MPVPFDGTPDGDMIGFHMEADRRRLQQATDEAIGMAQDAPATPLTLIAFLLAFVVVLFVMSY